MMAVSKQNHTVDAFPIRITAEVLGRTVKLFSASIQKSTGDLIINPKSGDHLRPDPESWITGERRYNTKIQIHMSEQSPDGNTTSFIINHEKSNEQRDRQFTKAIKSNGRFTPVCARLFPDLRHECWQTDDGSGKSYRIAKFDPKYISLISLIYVGKSGLRYNLSIGDTYNAIHISAGMFEVCIVSTYVNLPSIPHGNMLFYRTSKEGNYEDFADIIEGFLGKDLDKNTIKMSRRLVEAYINQCVNFADSQKFPLIRDAFEGIRRSGIKYSRTPYFERIPKSQHTLLTQYLVDIFKDAEDVGR